MKTYWILILIAMAGLLTPPHAIAKDNPDDPVHFILPHTTSLGSRGVVIVIEGEAPCPYKPPGRNPRLLVMTCFQISRVGSDPIFAPVGFSGGDDYPLGSTRFGHPLVSAYLTEKNEGITVTRNEEGSWYDANIPGPWAIETVRTLINFNDLGQPGPRDPMTAEISGTMANRDILITLHGKKETYFFGFAFDRTIRGWVRLAKPPAKAFPATTQSSQEEVKVADQTIGDQIRATLIDQQKVGVNAHMVTVFAEAPLPRAKGRRKAFYYFVQEGEYGDNLKFVASKTAEDDKVVGSGPGDDPAARPRGRYPGSLHTGNATFDLTVGRDVSHFKYEIASTFELGKWVKAENSKGS